MKRRAFTLVEIIIVIAALGGGAWAFFPSLFPGASKRAKASTTATAKLEETTNAKDAAAAASVATMLSASSTLPETPVKSFLSQEGTVALSLLPTPDPMALIAAEQRKNAVLSGRLTEAQRLYDLAAKKTEELVRERDAALAQRQQADLELEKAAASEHGARVQAVGIGLVATLFLIGYLYLKFTGISPKTLGAALADIRKGVDPTTALDTVLSTAQQRRVNRESRLAP